MLNSDSIQAITNLIFTSDKETKTDLAIVPGSSHKQIPIKASQLFKKDMFEYLIFTGGYNPKLGKSESQWGANIASNLEVPKTSIFSEDKSSNTYENAKEALKIININKLAHKNITLITKTFHARRVKMTFQKVIPNSKIFLIPVSDERNITKSNWWKNEAKTKEVMEEVEKIGKYYLKGDLS